MPFQRSSSPGSFRRVPLQGALKEAPRQGPSGGFELKDLDSSFRAASKHPRKSSFIIKGPYIDFTRTLHDPYRDLIRSL